ncbi:MAG: ABC transporter substrate-binding protein [candidate division WOR-3 bacterium]
MKSSSVFRCRPAFGRCALVWSAMSLTLQATTESLHSQSGGPLDSARKSVVEVSFWHAMGGPLGRELNAMIRDFELEHPGIRVNAVSMGDYGSLAQKLMSALWVQKPPTCAQMYESWTTQFFEAGELYPIESLIPASPDGLTLIHDIYPVLLESNSWNGQLVTLPFNKSVPCYYYNLRRFDSLGIQQFPRTWQEFRARAKQLTRRASSLKDWVWGTAGGVNASVFTSMLLAHNGQLLDDQGRARFAESAGVDVLTLQCDMILRDSSQVFSVGYSGQDDLLAGRIGMIYGTSVSRAFIRPKATFPVGMAPLPAWDRRAAIIQGTNIGLFRRSTPAEKAAAWEFIKWFIAPEQQARWARATFYVPVCRRALEIPEFRAQLDSVPGWGECVAQLDWGVFEPKSRVWFEGRKILDSGLEPALRGLLSPEEALRLAAAQMAPPALAQGRIGFFVLIGFMVLGASAACVRVSVCSRSRPEGCSHPRRTRHT